MFFFILQKNNYDEEATPTLLNKKRTRDYPAALGSFGIAWMHPPCMALHSFLASCSTSVVQIYYYCIHAFSFPFFFFFLLRMPEIA